MSSDPDNDYEAALAGWASGLGHGAVPASGASPASGVPQPSDEGDDLFSGGRAEVQQAAIERVAAWVRQRFSLAEDDAVLVSEVACPLPGCPPLETVIAFWTEGETRHHFKLFKPVAEIVYDDLPFAWLKDTLVVPEGFGCDCC